MGGLRSTRFAEIIVPLAAGLVLLGAATAANVDGTSRDRTGVADAGGKSRFVDAIHAISSDDGTDDHKRTRVEGDCRMCRNPTQGTTNGGIVPDAVCWPRIKTHPGDVP
jgi:hypothetical protein